MFELNMRFWGFIMIMATSVLGGFFALRGEVDWAVFMVIMHALGWSWFLWGVKIQFVRRDER